MFNEFNFLVIILQCLLGIIILNTNIYHAYLIEVIVTQCDVPFRTRTYNEGKGKVNKVGPNYDRGSLFTVIHLVLKWFSKKYLCQSFFVTKEHGQREEVYSMDTYLLV